ncbi:hypothetical protein EIP91_005936 [Steccherinum ochraceum]|uniref:Uncharacterized protein n=1 Tax=Steccherinum ochraceum TaxID=92696 RepID=A0A4R0RVJ1_9APHY|nr:hypothetical protein EIP91_005936 [Steccherinum ochraceum]
MDDDLALGASVWGSADSPMPTPTPRLPQTLEAPPLISPAPSASESIDDFDDFGTPAETIAASGDEMDDDFGDFGDFGDSGGQEGFGSTTFDESAFVEEPEPIAGPSRGTIEPLRLVPYPPREELERQIEELLHPLWDDVTPEMTHDWPIRQAAGLNQILITPESRQLYDNFFPPSPPIIKPVNWTRSRIRRQHLIALGIPVNLDEVLPPAGGKLPTLEIKTRPMSAPPVGAKTAPVNRTQPASTANNSRAGTPRPGTPSQMAKTASIPPTLLRLGPRPELDEAKVNRLLDLNPGELPMMPLKTLNTHLDSLKQETAQVSAVLTYLLQARDALQQDSETYNKLIAEMVGEAQKIKTGKRTAGSRRGSAM